MALDQSALLEVLDALTVAEVDDRIRQAAQTIYQALIEAELTSVIGAAPTSAHLTGWPSATGIAQGAGDHGWDLELRIPKLRAGRSSLACWSGAAGSTRRCSRW